MANLLGALHENNTERSSDSKFLKLGKLMVKSDLPNIETSK